MRTTLSRWGLGFLAWTTLGLLSVSQSAVGLASGGQAVDWGRLVPARMIDWYSCAVFTPVFFWLARRFPLGRRRWARHVPVLLAGVALISLLKLALQRQVMVRLFAGGFPTLGQLVERGFIYENMALWGVLAAVLAIEFYRGVREREVTASRLQARLSAAQLEALSARLNPHFLFNTLQGISTLVHRDPAAADAMLGHLSALLRHTLQRNGTHEVPLADELALLDEYLAIEQLRFGDRLRVERTVAPDSLTALVPHFVLQPLAENAVRHGVAQRAGAGRLAITARREGPTLRVVILDDGPGPAGAAHEGVGLGNTRRRLAELYGGAAAVTLGPAPDGGSAATLVLPWHEQPALPGGEDAA